MENEQSLKVTRRPGWEFDIPGKLLEIDSARWTPEQKQTGVHIRCVFPTPDDEKRSIGEAIAEGNAGAAVLFQVRNSLSELDGKVIPYLERELVWKALGPQGRALAIEFYQLANKPDEEAQAQARASFRVSV